jgi:hypothetical protein
MSTLSENEYFYVQWGIQNIMLQTKTAISNIVNHKLDMIEGNGSTLPGHLFA